MLWTIEDCWGGQSKVPGKLQERHGLIMCSSKSSGLLTYLTFWVVVYVFTKEI